MTVAVTSRYLLPIFYSGVPTVRIDGDYAHVRVPMPSEKELDTLPSERRSHFRTVFLRKSFGHISVSGSVVFTYEGQEMPVIGTPVTIMLLNRLADASPDYWGLVRYVIQALRIDPSVMSYRADCFDNLPSPLPLQLISAIHNPVQAWFAHHGYAHFKTESVQYGDIHIFQCTRSGLVRVAIYLAYKEREAKPERPEKLPQSILAFRAKGGHGEKRDGHTVRIPIFFSIPSIHNFAAEWENCKTLDSVYPCTPEYFDLRRSENLMYPRFVPSSPVDYKVPQFHPGPFIYSAISAPAACHAIMFSLDGPHVHFHCIRESFHTNRVIACGSEEFILAL